MNEWVSDVELQEPTYSEMPF